MPGDRRVRDGIYPGKNVPVIGKLAKVVLEEDGFAIERKAML